MYATCVLLNVIVTTFKNKETGEINFNTVRFYICTPYLVYILPNGNIVGLGNAERRQEGVSLCLGFFGLPDEM